MSGSPTIAEIRMRKAEQPFLDNWFANAAEREVKAWNAEHGFGKDNPDREIGKSATFDIRKAKPTAPSSE